MKGRGGAGALIAKTRIDDPQELAQLVLSRCDSYIAAKFRKGQCTQSIETMLRIVLKDDPSHFMNLVEHCAQ